jgi:uncharacterized membrane protein
MRLQMPDQHAADGTVQRLIAFSDGVFAIAITLLALNVRLPALAGPVDNTTLWRAVRDLWPHIFSFAVSFAVIGTYWMAHRRIFGQIPRGDEGLAWLNLLFLFCIAFLPFASDVIGDHGDLSVAAILYAVCVAATGFTLWLVSWHAYRQKLREPPLSRRAFALMSAHVLTAPAIFLLSIRSRPPA